VPPEPEHPQRPELEEGVAVAIDLVGRNNQREDFDMRSMLTTTALTLALLVPGAAVVHGEEKGGTAVTPPDAAATQVGDPAATADARGIDGTLGAMRGEQIIGQTLYSADGTELGEITDVVMRQGGTKPEFLVAAGGFLGIGERSVLIPIDRVRMENDRLTTSMSKESVGDLQANDLSDYKPWDRLRTLGSG
jgi:hypothetical protein